MCSHNQLYLPAVAEARRLVREGLLGNDLRGQDDRQLLQQPEARDDRLARATLDERRRRAHRYRLPPDVPPAQPGRQRAGRGRCDAGSSSAGLPRGRRLRTGHRPFRRRLDRNADHELGVPGPRLHGEVLGGRRAGSLWSDGQALYHRPRGGEVIQLLAPPDEKIETIPLAVLDFVACLREGRRPINTEVEGINVLKVILAAYASAEQGRTISLRDLQGVG